nr:hypothetical protein [Tanacetum cinerariifolium]
MVAILEKDEYNTDFHSMVDFIARSPLRIETTDEGTHILAIVDGIQRTVSESSLRHNLKLQDEDGISSLPDTELFENLTLMGYNISQNQKFTFQKDEPTSLVRDVSEGEAYLTESGFIADQDRVTIAKSSTLPHDSAPRVTSPAADEGKVEILKLKDRVKVLEDREGIATTRSGDDALIKGRSIDDGEAAIKRISDDSEELARVMTSIDAATVLVGGIDIPTGSGSIPTAGPPVVDITLAGKEFMVESDTPKKQRLQEQIDAQVTRELEEQQEREDKRMTEQIARDAEVARIHAEEELQGMIDSLDRTNETIAKYLQEYQDFALELPLERRIELINDLVKYQDNYSKIYKFQSQQRRPWTKKQKKDYYMTVIRNNLGWKVKDFKGITFKELKAKFAAVWKLVEDFIPMGSKEKVERLKRKGFNLEQEKAKKQKTSEEVPDKEKSLEEIPEKKVKEMMQLVPIKEVYVQSLQVKHPIINWKVHIEGQRSYCKIIRLGGSSVCYQFFVDLLKHLDREDLNQLWVLVKEYLSIRPASSDKEIEL